ncbi:hypothetical protein TKK_0010035 [Trichogramma kaykai]
MSQTTTQAATTQQPPACPTQQQTNSHDHSAKHMHRPQKHNANNIFNETTPNTNSVEQQPMCTEAIALDKDERRNNLGIFIDEHTPDVLAIRETKLSKKHRLDFNNYTIFRSDRDNKGGGTAILVNKSRINCSFVPLASNISIRTDLDKLFEELKLDKASNEYILIGDLNAKHFNWNNPVSNNNSRVRQLNRWVMDAVTNKNIRIGCRRPPVVYVLSSLPIFGKMCSTTELAN